MIRKSLLFLVLISAALLLAAPMLAEEITPDPHGRDNECMTGGRLEGKCSDSEWLWTFGWWLHRVLFHGMNPNDVPQMYQYGLPKPEELVKDATGATVSIICTITTSMSAAPSVPLPANVYNGTAQSQAVPGGFTVSWNYQNNLWVNYSSVGFLIWYSNGGGWFGDHVTDHSGCPGDPTLYTP